MKILINRLKFWILKKAMSMGCMNMSTCNSRPLRSCDADIDNYCKKYFYLKKVKEALDIPEL